MKVFLLCPVLVLVRLHDRECDRPMGTCCDGDADPDQSVPPVPLSGRLTLPGLSFLSLVDGIRNIVAPDIPLKSLRLRCLDMVKLHSRS